MTEIARIDELILKELSSPALSKRQARVERKQQKIADMTKELDTIFKQKYDGIIIRKQDMDIERYESAVNNRHKPSPLKSEHEHAKTIDWQRMIDETIALAMKGKPVQEHPIYDRAVKDWRIRYEKLHRVNGAGKTGIR